MYAYLSNDKVVHIVGAPGEFVAGTTAVITIPDGQTALIGDSWDGAAFITPVAEVISPTVSTIQFLMLFSSVERVAIRFAVAGNQTVTPVIEPDAVLADWWGIINDPRLTYIDLGLASVHSALDYLTSKSLIAVGRKSQIVLGQVV